LCGTCLVKVKGDIPPPQAEEQEVLDILASADPQARLACQIDLTADITIEAYAL
jgi:ferredoxin